MLSDEKEAESKNALRYEGSIFKRFVLSPGFRSSDDIAKLRTFHSSSIRDWSYKGVAKVGKVAQNDAKCKRFEFSTIKRGTPEADSLPPTFKLFPAIDEQALAKPDTDAVRAVKQLTEELRAIEKPNSPC